MYRYIYIYMYVYIYMYIHIQIYIYIPIHLYIYTCRKICIDKWMYKYIYVEVYVYVYMYVHVHICTCTCYFFHLEYPCNIFTIRIINIFQGKKYILCVCVCECAYYKYFPGILQTTDVHPISLYMQIDRVTECLFFIGHCPQKSPIITLDANPVQGGEVTQDALRCRSFSGKEPLITRLFCGK